MPELHIDISGSGQPLVMLHGWGMHGGVFRTLAEQLAPRHTVLAVDLPGHGGSTAFARFDDLPRLAEYCMQHLTARLDGAAILVGWSLGGLLAQFMAILYPDAVSKLILLNSTPCFRRRADWQCAIEDEVLARFAADLSDDPRGTLLRFLALQFMGTPHEKDDLRLARRLLFERPVPGRESLQQGLRLLRDSDLRAQLPQIQAPTLSIAGERDRLVPASASVILAEQVANGRAQIIRGAGHAPLLSHASTVFRLMESFIHEY